ncbi:MAG: PEP-CTERM sorting domain-containing protein [Pseudomonadota bacterium]
MRPLARLFRILLLTTLLSSFASIAQAAIIFSDDFNRTNSNTVGNGWTELEDDANDVAIRNGRLRLRDTLPGNPDAASTNAISTLGFTDIMLSFDWAASSNTESSDDFYVDWSTDNANFTNLFSTGLGGSGFESVSLGPLAGLGGNDPIYLRFWIDVSTSTETVRIDNVVLSGTRIGGPSRVSEPATLLLLGLGLLCLAGARRGIH